MWGVTIIVERDDILIGLPSDVTVKGSQNSRLN